MTAFSRPVKGQRISDVLEVRKELSKGILT